MSITLLQISKPDTFGQYAVIALAILTIVYVVFRPKFKKKDPLASPGNSPRLSLSKQRDVERQMETLLVELSNMARQITAQLDTRATKLELLIKEADERLEALAAAARAADAPIERRASVESVVAMPRAIPMDPRHAEIYSLADSGQSAQEIAKRLDRPNGEVELILALRQRV